MYLQNKYTTWYFNIINSAKSRTIEGYVEKHHIIPRSLGGIDHDDNIVSLTAREHFVCHLLLTKMLDGKNRYKMLFASRRMIGKYKPNSRIYEYIRLNANIASKELWKDPTWRNEVISSRVKRLDDPQVRKEMSERMKEVWQREDYVFKHKAAMDKVRSNPEWIENNRQKQKESWKDPQKRENRLKNRKPHSEERKRKQSALTAERNKITWQDPVIRAKRIASIKETKAKNKAAKLAALNKPNNKN